MKPMKLTLEVVVTEEHLAIINHVVIADPEQQPGETPAEAWVRRVWATQGIKAPLMIDNKINTHVADYREAKRLEAEQGIPYKDAATRDSEERKVTPASKDA